MLTANTMIPAQMRIREISHTVCEIDYRTVCETVTDGMFRVEDLARAYRGCWAMDRDSYGNNIVFANIRKDNIIFHTEVRYEVSDSDRKAIWNWYAQNREEVWEDQALASRLNRDAAVQKMSHGTPRARAEVALKYPEYQHLVPKDQYYDLYQNHLNALKKPALSVVPS